MSAARRSAATLGLERLMLMSLALVLSLAACQEPEQATGPSLSQSALPNSITLTYICGNAFRVRNTNPTVMTVTWDVYKTTEKGTLTLPAKPGTGPYSETYFTTVNKGTVRLFLDGVLIQTKANGNKPVCQLPADTTKPAIPTYGFPQDTAYLSPVAPDSSVYYRRLVSVSFVSGASGSTINQFLAKYSAVIVGGRPSVGAYVMQVPDPGASLDSLTALRSRMSAEPGVQFVILLTAHSHPPVVDARFPVDGSGFSRSGWGSHSPADPLWALKAIRAPLAWGCETGKYGSVPVPVGVVEWGFRPFQSGDDFAGGPEPIVRFATRTLAEPAIPGRAEELAWHGTAVAGVLTAAGDNGGGVAGVTWRSSLYLYSLGTATPTHPENEYLALVDEIIPRLEADKPRVVNFSIELTKSTENPQQAAELSMRLQAMLAAAPSMLIVKSAGNDAYVVTPDALAALPSGSLLLLDALVRTRQAGFRDRVIIVGGTERVGDSVRVADSLRFVDGETDIVAPAMDVRVLGGSPYATDVVDKSGTSFAAPMVAGVATQLLAMQPNLTPAQVKQYILAGAQEPRLDPMTGQTIGPGQLRLNRTGATQSVFQLDAYGALTLLSRSDPSTPLCGLAVLTALVDDSASQQAQTTVRIEGRPGVIYQGEPATVTVAQGGRRIGLDRGDGSLDLNLQNGFWDAGTVGAFRGIRQFLERDTAFIVSVNDMGEGIQIRGPSGQGSPEFPCATVAAGTYDVNFCRIGMVSNTGDWVHAVVERDNSDEGCGPLSSHFASFLVPVRGAAGGATVLRDVRFEACRYFEPGSWSFPVADVVAWRADGAVAWVAQSDASISTSVQAPDSAGGHTTYHSTITSMTTKFRQESVVSGVPAATSRTVSGPAVYALGWRVDGGSLLSYEYYLESFGVCVRTVRAGEAPEVEVAGPIQLPPYYCGYPQMESMPAAVIARSLTSALRPAGGSAATPRALSPVEARIRAIRRRAGPQVLLAN
jgi:hypothetical protein